MKHLVISDDATVEDIDAALAEHRATQRRQVIASTAAEYGEDIDELFEMRANAKAAGLGVTSPGGAIVPMNPGTPAAGHGHGAGRDVAGSSGNHQ